jgi:16S rRNA (uracil1498-N3)-methyltransferase
MSRDFSRDLDLTLDHILHVCVQANRGYQMMSFYFYVPPEELHQKTILLKNENRQHLKSLRLAEGASIVLSDGAGRACQARIVSLGPQVAEATIVKDLETDAEPPLHVALFIGIPKGSKIERIICQAVELGVKRITPIITARTVVQLPAAKGRKKSRRWQKIAASAAARCRRSYIPPVSEPLPFEEMLSLLGNEKLVLIPYENEKNCFLLPLLKKIKERPAAVALFTGPEGGISPAEMDKLMKLPGARPISLGNRILMAETAPLVVLSILMCLWGDLGKADA